MNEKCQKCGGDNFSFDASYTQIVCKDCARENTSPIWKIIAWLWPVFLGALIYVRNGCGTQITTTVMVLLLGFCISSIVAFAFIFDWAYRMNENQNK